MVSSLRPSTVCAWRGLVAFGVEEERIEVLGLWWLEFVGKVMNNREQRLSPSGMFVMGRVLAVWDRGLSGIVGGERSAAGKVR